MTYTVQVAGSAARALGERLPDKVVDACMAFFDGALSAHPKRVGRPLKRQFTGQWAARLLTVYRVRYRIDEHRQVVVVLAVTHRADAYRP